MGQTDGAQRAPVRVVYMPMMGSGRQVRFGVLVTTSGPSAQVQFDDCNCPQWVPLELLHRVEVRPSGWGQLMLWAEGGA
jgi:hypothetical protein